jgi:adenine deaminase
MVNRFSVAPLATMTRVLAATAAGRMAPELVITGARMLSVYTERILDNRELWITGGRIAAIVPAGTFKPQKVMRTKRYDARGGILAPGLVDPHVHIESSMMTACAYAEGALLNGTTTIFCDSHEIGNVCGVRGIEWMMMDARRAPLSIFLTVPSTIPAAGPEFETTGGALTADDIATVFDKWPEAVGLGEKMDFVQVVAGDERSHAILAEALKRGRPVSGHIYGRQFVAAYAASGVTDTHEAVDRQIADDLLEAGLWIFLRGGPPNTPWHSLPEAIKAVTELGASPKRVCVCTDDRDADDLFLFGLDWVARQAMAAGIKPAVAWSMGSLHPATRYAVDGEIGGLGHGRRADLVLLNDDFAVQSTWYGGELVVDNRKITLLLDRALSKRFKYPLAAYKTMRLPRRKLVLVPEKPKGNCRANVIRVAPPAIVTYRERIAFDGARSWDDLLAEHSLCFVAVIERHGINGDIAHGLLKDFGLREGAVASSVGHDAHNVIVAGRSPADMKVAIETIKALHGGVCVVRDKKVVASVALPIAGLLSEERAVDVARATAELKQAWSEIGCTLPYMGFNLLPLSVIPEARITDKGIILVPQMQFVPLFEEVG